MEHIMLGRKTNAENLEKDNYTVEVYEKHDANEGQRYCSGTIGKDVDW